MSRKNAPSVSPSSKKLQTEVDDGRYDLITTDDTGGLYKKTPIFFSPH